MPDFIVTPEGATFVGDKLRFDFAAYCQAWDKVWANVQVPPPSFTTLMVEYYLSDPEMGYGEYILQ